ncbi:hypothetical protein CEQ90_04600 [Lewinellaceae bacterium SD302]|nr:hypothetical protein CEQ90_04600 [Lewinellaceae bacterium SD302]
MKRYFIFLLILSLFQIPAQAQFGKTLGKLKDKADNVLSGGNPLSDEEVGNALKEALEVGVGEAVTSLNQKHGYFASPYKILVPEEAQQVVSKLKMVPGFQNVEQDLIDKMNEAAEIAAAKAKPIFLDAITGLTFKDAMNILMGEDDAATRYLEGTTKSALMAAFLPVIQSSLDEVNAREYWRKAVNTYNKLPLTKDVNPELDEHVTDKALVGMFGKVEEKEAALRDNPALRQTELLRKVFAKQDN